MLLYTRAAVLESFFLAWILKGRISVFCIPVMLVFSWNEVNFTTRL